MASDFGSTTPVCSCGSGPCGPPLSSLSFTYGPLVLGRDSGRPRLPWTESLDTTGSSVFSRPSGVRCRRVVSSPETGEPGREGTKRLNQDGKPTQNPVTSCRVIRLRYGVVASPPRPPGQVMSERSFCFRHRLCFGRRRTATEGRLRRTLGVFD